MIDSFQILIKFLFLLLLLQNVLLMIFRMMKIDGLFCTAMFNLLLNYLLC